MDKRIKECFAVAVRLGRKVAKEEAVLHEAERRVRMAYWELKTAEEDLLALLPKSAANAKVRLGFALSCTSTAQDILESLAS